jgi:hypothetical protein
MSRKDGKFFPQLCDHDWTCDLAFCIVITQHMNEWKINLQPENHIVNEMFNKIRSWRGESCPCALTKHHAMKAYWGSGGIAPLIL